MKLRSVLAASVIYALFAMPTVQAADDATLTPPASPAAELKIEVDSASYQLSPGAQGLRARPPRSTLPFGMDYNDSARALIMPLDDRNSWGVGLNLNAGSIPQVEVAPPSSFGLQPKRSPGLLLQRRF